MSLCHKFFHISYLKMPLKSYYTNYQSESFYTYLDYILALKCCRPCSEEIDVQNMNIGCEGAEDYTVKKACRLS